MKNMLLLCLTGLVCAASNAQVGQTEWTLVDAERNDREVPCSVWYPEGLDTTYPAVVFAHGFVMGPGDYEGLAQALVEAGYVFVSLGTEQGFAPDHTAYGLDLAFVAAQVVANAVGGVLDGLFNGRVAIAGHSMGGGAAWLAAEANPPVDAYVALAPAETNPSAVAAGGSIIAPTMVLSGTGDAVTPPPTQHVPLYESIEAAECKAFVSIIDGGHCGFADPGTLCDFGELGFQGLSHAEQLALTLDVIVPWLNTFLSDDLNALNELDGVVADSAELEFEIDCATSIPASASNRCELFIGCSPGHCAVSHTSDGIEVVQIWSSTGILVAESAVARGSSWLVNLTPGLYIATVNQAPPQKFVIY